MKLTFKTWRYLSLGFLALATVIRCLAFAFQFDSDIGYFSRGAVLPIVSLVLLLAGLAVGVYAAIRYRKEVKCERLFRRLEWPSFAAMFAMIGYMFYMGYCFFFVQKKILWGILVLFSVLGVVFFLKSFFGRQSMQETTAWGFGLVIYEVLVIFLNYTEWTTTLNSPIKMTLQLAALAQMLYFVTEFREMLQIPRRGFHVFAAVLMAGLSAYFSLPEILTFMTGQAQHALYFFSGIVSLMMTCYGVTALLSFTVDGETGGETTRNCEKEKEQETEDTQVQE